MCHRSVLEFFRRIDSTYVKDKKILEVGSRDVNGTVRPILTALGPESYLGVDIVAGRSVDRICNVERLVDTFGEETFDVVISSEMLEHVVDWRSAIRNIKGAVSRGGLVIITTRSFGFPHHDWPVDFWRYETDDLRQIFSDFDITILEADPELSGVFLVAKKPIDFRENDLSDIPLYWMPGGRRVKTIDPIVAELDARRWHTLNNKLDRNLLPRLQRFPIATLSDDDFVRLTGLLDAISELLTAFSVSVSQ
jgi:SAM-dependent methyltransferase